MKPGPRKQTSALLADGQCTLCGTGLLRVTSRRVRRGIAWLSPTWDPEVQVHEVCPACGARVEVG